MTDTCNDKVWHRVTKGTDDARGYAVAYLEGTTGVDREALEQMCDTFNELDDAGITRDQMMVMTWEQAQKVVTVMAA